MKRFGSGHIWQRVEKQWCCLFPQYHYPRAMCSNGKIFSCTLLCVFHFNMMLRGGRHYSLEGVKNVNKYARRNEARSQCVKFFPQICSQVHLTTTLEPMEWRNQHLKLRLILNEFLLCGRLLLMFLPGKTLSGMTRFLTNWPPQKKSHMKCVYLSYNIGTTKSTYMKAVKLNHVFTKTAVYKFFSPMFTHMS